MALVKNFLVHPILNKTSLNMDENKKIDCRAVHSNLFRVECLELERSNIAQFLPLQKPSFHCQCAIRHRGGSGCNLGESKKPSSTLKATSSEMPCRRK